MYVAREFKSWDEGVHLPPPGSRVGWCESYTPDRQWICTREHGHSGPHRAGVDACTWVAEWDDHRFTDSLARSADEDFFTNIGL